MLLRLDFDNIVSLTTLIDDWNTWLYENQLAIFQCPFRITTFDTSDRGRKITAYSIIVTSQFYTSLYLYYITQICELTPLYIAHVDDQSYNVIREVQLSRKNT